MFNSNNLYRMPWKMSDNAMSWLEPTRRCNITCDACFTINDPKSEKSLSQIRKELDTLLSIRKCDAVLIAGGEPLTHPKIVEIVKMVSDRKVKSQLITNGVSLDLSLLKELKANGLFGITFHIDSHQNRPNWKGKNEIELNELRQYYVDMVRSVKNLVCAFNTTIFPDTLKYVSDIVKWSVSNIRDVSVMTIIAARVFDKNFPFDYYVGNKKVDLTEMVFFSDKHYDNLTAIDLYNEVKKVLPFYEFCSFIGGTSIHNSLKWGMACVVGSNKEQYGCIGPKTMEIFQNFYHFLTGKFLAYSKPSQSKMGRLLLMLSIFDKELRKTATRYFSAIGKDPYKVGETVAIQTISLLQPVDILPNGEQDNCDGCPNGTVWNERLVPACQLDNYKKFGGPIQMVPKI